MSPDGMDQLRGRRESRVRRTPPVPRHPRPDETPELPDSGSTEVATASTPVLPDSGTTGTPNYRTTGVPESAPYTPGVPNSRTTELPESVSADTDSRTPVVPDSQTSGPRYLEMERKEARLRPDQVTELAALARYLSRTRADKSERITDNTLIRIAVDVVLAVGDKLTGDTEDELRASMAAALGWPTDYRGPGLR